MKKTISINIGGNIFHIEEEGYDKLKSYLDSVHSYFAGFEDSKEIIDDIENRIAEKFYSQLKKNKEAITKEEVDQLIASMGTVEDFDATIDEEPLDQETQHKSSEDKDKEQKSQSTTEERKLHRDTKNKVLGGVASGIAYYFNIDPLWIRLLWIIVGFSGFGILVYIIFWIVLPEKELEDKKSIKKFFRNPDDQVIGGVSGGIGAFFGIDPVVVRVLFVASIFLGGTGLILYLILWIITPEAKTVTEKMEMKGEPVTVAGIEKNVKKNLNINPDNENVFVKVLLFPFRVIAVVFEGLGRALGPLLRFSVDALRVILGAILVITGFLTMVSLLFVLLFALGLDLQWGGTMAQFNAFPIEDFINPSTIWGSISSFFVMFIPALGLTLLGLMIMLQKRIGNTYLVVSLVGLWILAVVGASLTIPGIVNQFRIEETATKELTFRNTGGKPYLKLNEIYWDDFEYEGVDLRLRGHSDSTFLLVTETEAHGATSKEAIEFAEGVSYQVTQDSNVFNFDSRITFSEDTKFRFQQVDATFYIPYGVEFEMDQEIEEILRNTLHINGYAADQIENNTWVFDEFGINCTTCQRQRSDYSASGNTRTFNFRDFSEIDISAAFDVHIEQDDDFEVELKGKPGDLDDVILDKDGDRLVIDYADDDRGWQRNSRDIEIYISLPELTYFKASGECEVTLEDIEAEDAEFEFSGDTEITAEVEINDDLEIALSGSSRLSIRGEAQSLNVTLGGVSRLEALRLDARDARIFASGNARARVIAEDELTIKSSANSHIEYAGSPKLTIHQSGNSRISQH